MPKPWETLKTGHRLLKEKKDVQVITPVIQHSGGAGSEFKVHTQLYNKFTIQPEIQGNQSQKGGREREGKGRRITKRCHSMQNDMQF